MGSLLFIFGFLWGTPVHAKPCYDTVDEVAPAYLFVDHNIYRPLMCSDTIFAFVQNLKSSPVDLADSKVVVLRHKGAPHMGVEPLQPRLNFKEFTYKAAKWGFHMFLVIDGLVFDFDNTDFPQAVGIEAYMGTMWDPLKLRDYVVQIKAAEALTPADLYGEFKGQGLISAANLMTMFTKASCTLQSPIGIYPWSTLSH